MGKRTTTRHKADNTFKFQTFAEKLAFIHASIETDFRNDLSLGKLDPNDERPLLFRCYDKWIELNKTESCYKLLSKIEGDIINLPQILHSEKHLKESILSHICDEHKLSLEVTFELAVSFSTDIGKEFDKYRFEFISRTVDVICKIKDVEILESGFKCLAYLIKKVNPSLSSMVIGLLNKLFKDNAPVYLKVLGGQCIHRLVADVWKNKADNFFLKFLQMMADNKLSTDAAATIMYCVLRGVNGNLRPNGEELLSSVVTYCFMEDKQLNIESSKDLWREFVRSLIEKLVEGLDKSKRSAIFTCVISTCKEVLPADIKGSTAYEFLDLSLKNASKEIKDEINTLKRLDGWNETVEVVGEKQLRDNTSKISKNLESFDVNTLNTEETTFDVPELMSLVEILNCLSSRVKNVRSKALSYLYKRSANNEGRILALKTCIEIEAIDIHHSIPMSEINLKMDRLISLSQSEEQDLIKMLLSFGLGTLYRDYSPLQAKAMELIKHCWLASRELGFVVLSHLEKHCKEFVDRTNQFDKGLGFSGNESSGSGDKPYDKFKLEKYCGSLWNIVADVVANASLRKELLCNCSDLAIRTIKEYYSTHKCNEDKSHDNTGLAWSTKFVGPAIKVLGACIQQGILDLDQHIKYFQYFLMSTSAVLRATTLAAFYNAQPLLAKYRDQIDIALHNKSPDLTSFSIDAAEPIIKEAKDRATVLKMVLPICARIYLTPHKKKMGASKVKTPIAIGMLGLEYTEVVTFLKFVIGNPRDFKFLTTSSISKRISTIHDLLLQWENKFPEIVKHMTELVLLLVEATNDAICDDLNTTEDSLVTASTAQEEETAEILNEDMDLSEETLPNTETSHNIEAMHISEEACNSEAKLTEDIDISEQLNEETVSEKHTSANNRLVIASALKFVTFVFERFPDCWDNSEILHRVMILIIMPRLEKCVENSTGSVTRVVKLLVLWSRIPRYRSLFFAVPITPEISNKIPLQYVGGLLRSPNVHHSVKADVLKIFFNVLDFTCDDKFKQPVQLKEPMLLKMLDSQFSIETNILMFDPHLILKLGEYLDFSRISKNSQLMIGYLKILQVVISHSTSELVQQSLQVSFATNLINLSLRGQSLIQLLKLMKEIILKMCYEPRVIIGLSKLFRVIENREQRAVLLDALEGINDKDCFNVLHDLNSYDPMNLLSPDYKRRSDGWNKLRIMLSPGQKFECQRFCLIGNHLMFILTHNAQSDDNRNALNCLTSMAKLITNHEKDSHVELFLDTVLMYPTLKSVVLNPVKRQTFDFRLQVLRIFALHCPYDNILKGLQVLVHNHEEHDIICGLVDINVNNRTKAMNRLIKLLELQRTEALESKPFKHFGQNLLLNYLLPIATNCIVTRSDQKSTKQESVFNNFIQSSLEMYKVSVMLLTPKQYFSFLGSILQQKPKDSSEFKRYKREILAVMNGFIYDFRESPNVNMTSFSPVLRKLLSLLSFTKNSNESEETNLGEALTVECTVGLVKLLKKFPTEIGADILSPLIPNICTWLKSKSTPERRLARQTLISFMKEAGVEYFSKILSSLQANLKVGYQKHVLTNTVYCLMSSCESQFAKSDLVLPVKSILPMCEDEFFGVMNEEKGIGKIVEKTREARKPNAENILVLCSKLLSRVEGLTEMIKLGLNHIRVKLTEHNIAQVRKWLASVVNGLTHNEKIPAVDVLLALNRLRSELGLKNEEKVSKLTTSATKPRSTYEIKTVSTVKNSTLTESTFFHLLELKVLYHYYQQDRDIPLEIYLEFYPHILKSLDNSSIEIMLLAHRLLAKFLEADWNSSLPETLPDIPKVQKYTWEKLIINVSTYCTSGTEDSSRWETMNLIWMTIGAFLREYPEFKLKQTDFTILIASFQNLISNEQCFSSVFQILSGIIDKKVEEKLISSIMNDVLKASVRSTTAHVVEACRKLYLKYVMNYAACKPDGLDIFMRELYNEAKRADQIHEKCSILTTLGRLLRETKMISLFRFFRDELPIIALECLMSDTKELRNIGLEFMEILTSSKGYEVTVCKYGQGMLEKKPPVYNSVSVTYLSRIFNALLRDSESKQADRISSVVRQFLHSYTNYLYQLVKMDEEAEGAMNAAFEQMFDIITEYLKRRKCWDTMGILEQLWEELIRFIGRHRLDYYLPIVKYKTLEIVQLLLKTCKWSDVVDSMCKLVRIPATTIPKPPLSFFSNPLELKELIVKHFQILKITKVLPTKMKAAENLIILAQLVSQVANPDVEMRLNFGNAFVVNVKSLINEEVVLNPKVKVMREIGYKILLAYIHFIGISSEDNLTSIIPNYETRKTELGNLFRGDNYINYIEQITLLAVRDITDNNTSDDIRKLAEKVCDVIQARFGEVIFKEADEKARSLLRGKRLENKTKKAENAVLHPGIKRKRTNNSHNHSKKSKS